jgi:hypothetical protein
MSEDKTSTLENETCAAAPTGQHTSHEQQCSEGHIMTCVQV